MPADAVVVELALLDPVGRRPPNSPFTASSMLLAGAFGPSRPVANSASADAMVRTSRAVCAAHVSSSLIATRFCASRSAS